MSRRFEIIVAPNTRSTANKLHFAALECDLILVGESASISIITDYCSSHLVTEEGRKVFAIGSCESGQLIFADDTPGWKRDELREFLAGIGLELAVTVNESRRENAAEMEDFLARAVGEAHIVRF